MKIFSFVLTLGFGLAIASQASALSVEYTTATSKVTPEQSAAAAGNGGSAPVDGDIHQFFVTTDADILSIGNVRVALDNGELFQNTFGDATDSAPPNPGLVAAFPALGADSFITTPGAATSRLAGDINNASGELAQYGDLSDDGPQSSFMFAQLTVPGGTTGLFTGQVSINDGTGASFDVPFSFALGAQIPEPTTLALFGLGMVGLVGLRRRQG